MSLWDDGSYADSLEKEVESLKDEVRELKSEIHSLKKQHQFEIMNLETDLCWWIDQYGDD